MSVYAELRVQVTVRRKSKNMVLLEHDESRSLALEGLENGQAFWETGKRLGMSKEVVKGCWLSADVFASLRLPCPVTERGVRTAANISDEITEEVAMSWLERASDRIDQAQEELLHKLPTGSY